MNIRMATKPVDYMNLWTIYSADSHKGLEQFWRKRKQQVIHQHFYYIYFPPHIHVQCTRYSKGKAGERNRKEIIQGAMQKEG